MKNVGVVGGGLMGSGIAEVSARAGHDVVVVESSDDAGEGRARRGWRSRCSAPRRRARSTRPPTCSPGSGSTPTWTRSPTATSSSRRSSRTRPPRSTLFKRLDEIVDGAGRDPRVQHLVDPDHEAGRGHLAPDPGDRHPLLQPGAGAPARRAGAVAAHLRRHDRALARLGRGRARQAGDRLPGPRRLRRQRAADPVHPLRDPDVRVRLRLRRGHRPRPGARRRAPAGPARAGRPDRPGHHQGRRRVAVRGVQGAAVRRPAAAAADGRRRPARPQDRPRASTRTPDAAVAAVAGRRDRYRAVRSVIPTSSPPLLRSAP